jgi:hypothetical protein
MYHSNSSGGIRRRWSSIAALNFVCEYVLYAIAVIVFRALRYDNMIAHLEFFFNPGEYLGGSFCAPVPAGFDFKHLMDRKILPSKTAIMLLVNKTELLLPTLLIWIPV